MKINRIVTFLWLILLLAMTACTPQNEQTPAGACSVVCTVFPAYDWTCALLANGPEEVKIEYLLDDGADVHSFQPGAEDYVKIAESDIFIYIGGSGSEWIQEALDNQPNPDRIVIDLSCVEGMTLLESSVQTHHHDLQEEHCEEEHLHDGETVYDEHIWMSLKNAGAGVNAIAEALCQKLPESGALIHNNLAAYRACLENLDANYYKAVSDCEKPYLLIADRFPFLYMTNAYGISYDAAFAGCQTESEADFDMIIRLASLADQNAVPVLVISEVSDTKLAETVLENSEDAGREILVLDSMQAVTAGMVQDGKTYLAVMENNLEVLKTALAVE